MIEGAERVVILAGIGSAGAVEPLVALARPGGRSSCVPCGPRTCWTTALRSSSRAPSAVLARALQEDRPTVIDVHVEPGELIIPPRVETWDAVGFGVAKPKEQLGGGSG